MIISTDMGGLAADLAAEIARKTELQIKNQLNDFISRGLIVIEYGPMSFVSDGYKGSIDYRQTVTLRLKDREYIEQLEKDLEKYKQILGIIGEVDK